MEVALSESVHQLERAARALLDALDRQHGGPPLSARAADARAALRELLPVYLDAADEVWWPTNTASGPKAL